MNIQEYWPNHPEFKAISVYEVNLIKKRKVSAWDMSTNTAKHNKTWKAQQNKVKQSFAKHGFVKTEKKKKTIFYIATANFWTKIIICFVNDCRKQGFLLYIIGGNVNGTKFKPGNLLLYIKITTLIFLRIYPADIFIPMQNDIYTKLLIALLLLIVKAENNLNAYQQGIN